MREGQEAEKLHSISHSFDSAYLENRKLFLFRLEIQGGNYYFQGCCKIASIISAALILLDLDLGVGEERLCLTLLGNCETTTKLILPMLLGNTRMSSTPGEGLELQAQMAPPSVTCVQCV